MAGIMKTFIVTVRNMKLTWTLRVKAKSDREAEIKAFGSDRSIVEVIRVTEIN
jgi:hypothetical protein